MPSSGTYASVLPADELLDEAWERCALDPRTLTERHARSALRSIEAVLVAWTNRGLNLWQVDRQSATLAVGAATLTLPASTSDVLEAFVTDAGADLALSPMSRDEWMALPRKLEPGRPTSYWVERVNAAPVLHLWPVPDRAYPLGYSRIRVPQDVSALSQTVDAPRLWTDALCYAVAARLAEKFAPAAAQALEGKAAAAFADAAGENRERAPLRLVPDLG
jgi:hypothetical protein